VCCPLTKLLVAQVNVRDSAHVHLEELALALQSIPLALEHVERLCHAHFQQNIPDEVVQHLWASGDGGPQRGL